MRPWVFLLLLGSACATANTVECDDGTLCSQGLVCAVIVVEGGASVDFCVLPSQIGECTANGLPCDELRGTCHDAVCIPNACGNQLRDTGEACDDGNIAAKDGCASDCTSNETCGNELTDLLVGERCDLGDDAVNHDGCSSTCSNPEAPVWSRAELAPLYNAATAYDVGRHRLILFGGHTATGELANDTWEWDGQRWTRRSLPLSPPGRELHSLVYDAARKNIVLFGGFTGDTWTLDATGWHHQNPTMHPSSRYSTMMAYDAKHQRVVLYGGLANVGEIALDDLWSWDGADWTPIAHAAPWPPPTIAAAVAYDATRERIVMYGGRSAPDMGVTNEMWELDGDTWSNPTPLPGPRLNLAKATFDPIGRQVLIGGGYLDDTAAVNGTIYTWNGSTLGTLGDTPDSPFFLNALDVAFGHAVLHSQFKTFRLDGSSWTLVNGAATPPKAINTGLVAVSIPTKHQILVFDAPNNQTWIWDGWWKKLAGGMSPGPRRFPSIAYDSMRDEVVLFGGYWAGAARDDMWIFKDGQWMNRTPDPRPTVRSKAAFAFDNSGNAVLFGGEDNNINPLDDTWVWNGTAWTEKPTSGPSARRDPSFAFDVSTNRFVLFGGNFDSMVGPSPLGDTWIWDGQAWSASTEDGPSPRHNAGLVLDVARNRLVLIGGAATVFDPRHDSWEWTGSSWEQLVTASAVDPLIDGTIVVQSLDGAGALTLKLDSMDSNPNGDSVWQLRWDGGAPEEACTSIDTDGDRKVGCADDDCRVACAHCGDGACNTSVETCDLCPSDCGACTF